MTFSFVPFLNYIENRTISSLLLALIVISLILSIVLFGYLLVKIGPDAKLTKEEKKYYFKKDIITKIVILIILIPLMFIFLLPINIAKNKLYYLFVIRRDLA